MAGADGFRLMYFHLLSGGISVLLSVVVFLILAWKVMVGSVVALLKLFSSRKFGILDSYCCMGSMTFARVIMALFRSLV